MASIYGLYDAEGELRYIGKANDPAARLKSHIRDARRLCRTPLHNWLNKHGPPAMILLEENCADWIEAERRLISKHRKAGAELLNIADGGDMPFCPRSVRQENGRKVSKDRVIDPRMEKLRVIKSRLRNNYNWLVKWGQKNGDMGPADRIRARLHESARLYPHLFGDWAKIT